MIIITLTTDLGKNNYNIASLKGAILSSSSDCQIVDISNEISNFDIIEGAFILQNSYIYFPKSSIHIIAINNYYAARVRILVFERDGYFFIAPDNGILSLMFDDIDDSELRYVEYGLETGDFYLVIAKIIKEIISFKSIEKIGFRTEKINKRISIQPVVSGNIIRATVIFVDKFGNAILNIKKSLFKKLATGRSFELKYAPKNHISKISNKYSDVPYGDELCLYNSAGYLEIAVNMGNASELLGLEKGSIVQIVFSAV